MNESTGGPARRALLIAIDRYPHLEGSDLQGCVNDMTALAELLRARFGFAPERVRLLVDAAATRDAILSALDELAAAVEDDDIVVLAFAGHGSQVTDLEREEADKLLDYIMQAKGFQGDTMGDRLKLNGDRFSDLNGIWTAHKLRNQIAHEVAIDIVKSQVEDAVRKLGRGIQDLGVTLS